jgi:arylsulfatase A-like enzyme
MPRAFFACTVAILLSSSSAFAAEKPNIVVVMADDLGWRDAGYHGNTVIKTPNLDDMAAKGVRFDYFYSAQQMCSPGRFALMTGRNPFRTGLHHLGSMRPQEVTIAEAVKSAGYKTAQFGKWHLGGGNSTPARQGFDKATWSINYYDLGAKLQVNDTQEKIELKGDTSVAAMDLALEWIREQAKGPAPFLAYVAFGSPHSPHRAAPEFKELYKGLAAGKIDFLGEVSGLDAAVGNLRAELRKLGIADNTIVWFASDNGGITPDSKDPAGRGKMQIGVRTQGLVEWPGRIKQPIKSDVVVTHADLYPTILDITGVSVPNQPPVDGVNLMPLFEGAMKERPKPLGFMLWNEKKAAKFDKADFVADTQGIWIDGPYKLTLGAGGKKDKNGPVQLVNIFADPAEKTNLAEKEPERVKTMTAALDAWRRDVRASFDGRDYKTQ